jgi:hypothetical protein
MDQALTAVSVELGGAGGAFATAGGGVTGGWAAFPLSDSPADPLAGLAGWQPAPQTQVAALPAAAVLVGGVSVADIVAVFVVAYSGAFLLNDRRGAQAAVATMARDIADRLQWPAAQLATAQAELSRVLNNLSASVRRGRSPAYMKQELGGAIAALHQRFAGAAPGAPAASPAQRASGASTAPRLAAPRQEATRSPPALRSALSAETIQSLQRMLPTQSVVKALAVAGYSPDRAPQALTSLPAMAAQYAKLPSLQSSPQWPLLARHLGPEVSAIRASLGQANGAMTRDARQATSLMNVAEQRLHGGKPLSGDQSAALRSTAAQLQRLQSTIQKPYAALRTAGLYVAERHPVARQIATWLASFPSRLDAVTRPTAAGSSSVPITEVAATAATAPGLSVDRRTAAVDAAVQAIGEWGRLAGQWAELPTNASPERREELAALVMSAGQQLQQALVQPDVVQVMKAGGTGGGVPAAASSGSAAAASPSPNGWGPGDGGDKDPKGGNDLNGGNGLRQRLLNALVNGIGSILGDGLQKQFGAPMSVESMRDGAVIAASLGLVLPPGAQGVFKGSVINGAAGAAETLARQIRGLDPWDPSAVLASLAFGGAANAAVHFFRPFFFGLTVERNRWRFEQLPSDNARMRVGDSRHRDETRRTLLIDIFKGDGEPLLAVRNQLRPNDPDYYARPVLYVSQPDSAFEYLQNFHPSNILLRGRGAQSGSQVPVTPADWARIAVFSWHGGIKRFAGLSTTDAAKHMAREVVEHNTKKAPSAPRIEYVLLHSCHQGTKGGLLPLWGTTNAKTFADALNAELRRLEAPAVDVLAARDAGKLVMPLAEVPRSTSVISHLKPNSIEPVVFVTSDQQRGSFDLGMTESLVLPVVAASIATSFLAAPAREFVYDIVKSDSDEGK